MSAMKSTVTTMVLALGLVTVLAATIIAFIYYVTAEPIRQAQERTRTEAIGEVLPPFDALADPVEVTPQGDTEPVTVYRATKGGRPVGAAVQSYTHKGFSGDFSVMYGFDSQGRVTGYRVLAHSETAGLGAKMGDWFRSPEGKRSVIGSDPDSRDMRVAKDGGDVDAITAATISSRAFLDALDRAHKALKMKNEQ